MAVRKKRILILTADAGFGHRSAAIALEEALKFGMANDRCQGHQSLNDKHAP